MSVIRTLIVDDSVTVRHLLSKVLNEDPDIAVVGTAANAEAALKMLSHVKPDVAVVDIDLPGMNGVKLVSEIRRLNPRVEVIMFSAFTTAGGPLTLDALRAGAADYVTKPKGMYDAAAAATYIQKELTPRIQAVANIREKKSSSPPLTTVQPPGSLAVKASTQTSPDAVVIGCSTGGPDALARVIPRLPGTLPVPILIVQHMPPVFTKLLARRLDAASQLSVFEGAHGMVPRRGQVLIAPGDFHMKLKWRGPELSVHLDQTPEINACRPAVDALFDSAADVLKERALGVVLTGMGRDGLQGSDSIRKVGGQVIVQDEPTSVVWGMPGVVARGGLADGQFPIDQIAEEIVRRCEASAKLRGGESRQFAQT